MTIEMEGQNRLVVRDPDDGLGERMVTISSAIARMVPGEVCRRHTVLALDYRDGIITVVAPRADDEEAGQAITAATGYEPRWLIADADEIERVLEGISRTGAGVLGPDQQKFGAQDLVSHGLAIPPRLGEELAGRGLISEQQLGEAIEEQARSGGRIGEVLVHDGALKETALLKVLAERVDLPVVDLSEFDVAKSPQGLIPEPVCSSMHCLPLALDERDLFVALPDVPDTETMDRLRSHTDRAIHVFLAPANDIDALLRKIHNEDYTRTARFNLLERFPDSSAHTVLSNAQKGALLLGVVVAIAFAIVYLVPTLIVIFAIASIFYTATSLYKLVAGYAALEHRYEVDVSAEDLAAIDERELPMYTILVPLFREASVIEQLVSGINALDYPKTKLDVRLLCEEDDEETIEAIRALDLAPHFKPIIVPESQPQTKPKACNYGLLGAKGKYVVIYDAEDRPDPDQLKKSVVMFDRLDEEVVCVQAKLNFFNQDTNFLTRWFSIEYSTLFDLILPGLDARNDPIPLGGTSNHLRLDRLVEVGGWDPYNVTEDADLGIRLHKAGYRTAMMDSTTLEEANSEVGNWVRQRSRWIKGYIQTWLVYMRHPVRLLGDVGLKGFFSFQLLVGGTFIFLLNPIFWTLTTIFAITQAGFIQELFPNWVYYLAAAQLFLGNFVFVYLGLAAAVRRRYYGLAPYALLLPLYWGLMSVAAWKGFGQLFTNPFYWEKTEHGLDMSSPGTTV